jgi:hypothetical protein
MLDYKEPNIRKQIAAILITVAKKIEEDEAFAKSIFDCLDERLVEIKNIDNTKKSSTTTPTNEINIFEIYQKEGPPGLMAILKPLELKELKKNCSAKWSGSRTEGKKMESKRKNNQSCSGHSR